MVGKRLLLKWPKPMVFICLSPHSEIHCWPQLWEQGKWFGMPWTQVYPKLFWHSRAVLPMMQAVVWLKHLEKGLDAQGREVSVGGGHLKILDRSYTGFNLHFATRFKFDCLWWANLRGMLGASYVFIRKRGERRWLNSWIKTWVTFAGVVETQLNLQVRNVGARCCRWARFGLMVFGRRQASVWREVGDWANQLAEKINNRLYFHGWRQYRLQTKMAKRRGQWLSWPSSWINQWLPLLDVSERDVEALFWWRV